MHQLAAPASAEIEIKKSRFIGMLLNANSRAQAREWVAMQRALHPGACHVCWALICESDSGLDDDGERSGTAAKPMYNVLMHKDLMNVLAVVVRYWGGIKLGAGGLTRAYGQAISEAVKTATLVPIEAECEMRYVLPFAEESSLRRLCEQHQVAVLNAAYAESVTLQLRMKQQQADAFEDAARNLLRGALTIIRPT